MTDPKVITILGRQIPVANDQVDISKLRFLPENPRVYAVTHGTPGFSDLAEEQQQDAIFRALCAEPSVTNLKSKIRMHGGLLEPIVVRIDNYQVIEGNSRLAVYRQLHSERADGSWDRIPCDLISTLSDEEQAAYLQQIHVKGKTQWSAYEKANFAYVHRHDKGWPVARLAELFGESGPTIRKKIAIIQMMADNADSERRHFSYYEVIAGLFTTGREKKVGRSLSTMEPLRQVLLDKIRSFGPEQDKNDFSAMEMRKQAPYVMAKPKVERKFIKGTLTLEEAFEIARESLVEERLRKIVTNLSRIERSEVEKIESGRIGAFEQQVKKARRQVERLRLIVEALRGR